MKLNTIILTISSIFFTLILNNCKSTYKCLDESCESGKARLESRYCDLYEGEVLNGRPFGFGVMNYVSEKCIDEGYSRGSRQHLKSYSGFWANDKNGITRWNGKGEMFYDNGIRLTANFKDDNIPIDSEIYISFPSGTTIKGSWGVYDNFLKEKSIYMGCSGNCLDGEGTLILRGGKLFKGKFKKGRLYGECHKIGNFYSQKGTCIENNLMSGEMKCSLEDSEQCKNILINEIKSASKDLKKEIPLSNVKLLITEKYNEM